MPDSIMYQEDGFVVLETNQPEQFLTHEELSQKLREILQTRQENLPRELNKFNSLKSIGIVHILKNWKRDTEYSTNL